MKNFLLTGMADFDFTEAAVDHMISQTLKRYLPKNRHFKQGEKTQIRMALKAFLLRCRSSEMRTEGVDVSFIRENGFDEVVEMKGLNGNMFTSGLSYKDLKRFRETIKKIYLTQEQNLAIVDGVGNMVAKQVSDESRSSDEYFEALKPALKRFADIHAAYCQASNTKDFTPECVARIAKETPNEVRKMIHLYNKFMPKEIKFNWKLEGLAIKVVSFGKAA
jgi:hypothetical protein